MRFLLYRSTTFTVLLSVLLTTACSDDGQSSDTPDAAPNADAAEPTPNVWTTLVEGPWTLEPGTERYLCVRHTVPEDAYITEFRAKVPLGSHHSVLSVGNPSGPDGIEPCTSFANHAIMIYGAGVNTDEMALPNGVAMRVRAGQQLLLNLHLYNVSDGTLEGVSGVDVKYLPASQVQHEAEAVLMGKVTSLSVPPGESTQRGTCTMTGDVTVFMVGPHMHQLGTHMRVVASRSGMADAVLIDEPYNFEDQQGYPIEPIEMNRGDDIDVYCSYNNTTGSTVHWGESSDEEMCFATVYRYPALGAPLGIACAND